MRSFIGEDLRDVRPQTLCVDADGGAVCGAAVDLRSMEQRLGGDAPPVQGRCRPSCAPPRWRWKVPAWPPCGGGIATGARPDDQQIKHSRSPFRYPAAAAGAHQVRRHLPAGGGLLHPEAEVLHPEGAALQPSGKGLGETLVHGVGPHGGVAAHAALYRQLQRQLPPRKPLPAGEGAGHRLPIDPVIAVKTLIVPLQSGLIQPDGSSRRVGRPYTSEKADHSASSMWETVSPGCTWERFTTRERTDATPLLSSFP